MSGSIPTRQLADAIGDAAPAGQEHRDLSVSSSDDGGWKFDLHLDDIPGVKVNFHAEGTTHDETPQLAEFKGTAAELARREIRLLA